ncbi:MAG TPA: hypothetical protein VF832_10945 [Longimicrobiales bacterium]
MAEVLFSYDAELSDDQGRIYRARACDRQREDGSWEGWLEFVPLDGGPVVRTARETTQPSHQHVEYWATGLTAGYLDGALHRATKELPYVGPIAVREEPAGDGPAPHRALIGDPAAARPRAVLDPFAVYAEGDNVLRGQLSALDGGQLRNIVKAYALSALPADELERLRQRELVSLIMGAVSERADRYR